MTAVIISLVFILILVAAASYLTGRRRPREIDRQSFVKRWNEVQKLCSDQATWPLAIINADSLLDDALKRLRYKGKSMGERLVSAQRDLSNNDSVWFGHKLRNRLVHEQDVKLKEKEVKDALLGLRQALKDLGALPQKDKPLPTKPAAKPVTKAAAVKQPATVKQAPPARPAARPSSAGAVQSSRAKPVNGRYRKEPRI